METLQNTELYIRTHANLSGDEEVEQRDVRHDALMIRIRKYSLLRGERGIMGDMYCTQQVSHITHTQTGEVTAL